MYFLVINKNKLAMMIIVLVLLLPIIYFLTINCLFPKSEITLNRRISFVFPYSSKISSLYMVSMEAPVVETGVHLGGRWKTEKIQQLEMSEITFQYPEVLILKDKISLGQDIRIHMNFHHTNNKALGFFQVWSLGRPLKDFLDESKKYSSIAFIDFTESLIQVDNLDGFMWEYVFASKEKDIVGMEAFIENGNEMYRFSLFVPKENYKPSYKKMFKRMFQSLRVKGTETSPDLSFVGVNYPHSCSSWNNF